MTKALIQQSADTQVSSYYTATGYYPWQQLIWQKLFTSNIKTDHFPHAILLNGVAGIGKKDLAFYLAKGLLCHSPSNISEGNTSIQPLEPCHQCRACQLFSSGNHPDLFHLTTPEDKKVIPVDGVRELIQWSVLNSQLGGKKIIIIEPAEAMNQSSANSLLKTLEEPVSDTIIILVSDKKQALLATIRSRCQNIDLVLPDKETALNWLQQQLSSQACNDTQEHERMNLMLSLANGSPLLA